MAERSRIIHREGGRSGDLRVAKETSRPHSFKKPEQRHSRSARPRGVGQAHRPTARSHPHPRAPSPGRPRTFPAGARAGRGGAPRPPGLGSRAAYPARGGRPGRDARGRRAREQGSPGPLDASLRPRSLSSEVTARRGASGSKRTDTHA